MYEHPLIHGGGVPSTQADFPQRLSNFISQDGQGDTGEALLRSYFGPSRRNDHIPDLVVAFGKGRKDPVMALVFKGRRVDRLPNEAYVGGDLYGGGSPDPLQDPRQTRSARHDDGDSKEVCLKEASQLQVRLEGLAYEKEKASGINAMEVIRLYTGKEPSIVGQKGLEGGVYSRGLNQDRSGRGDDD
ncbi:MAG: hypothetical protein IPP70_05190 [Elusimicrobia bacterium]|nr:hypothetical protein [Elusimicrobiota bacterium]